jgi:hypothetical protein
MRGKIESDPRHIFVNQLIVLELSCIKVQNVVMHLVWLRNDILVDSFINQFINFFWEVLPDEFKVLCRLELSSEQPSGIKPLILISYKKLCLIPDLPYTPKYGIAFYPNTSQYLTYSYSGTNSPCFYCTPNLSFIGCNRFAMSPFFSGPFSGATTPLSFLP